MCDGYIRIISDGVYGLSDLIQFRRIVAVCFMYDGVVYGKVDECASFLSSGFQPLHLWGEKYELWDRYRPSAPAIPQPQLFSIRESVA